MDINIEKKYEFDEVFDGQAVYRKILKTMSNPGVKCDISEEANKINSSFNVNLALAMTLLDNEVNFFVNDEAFQKETEMLTLSKNTGIEEADFAFTDSLDECKEILKKCKKGTLRDPQKSCTIIYGFRDEKCVPVKLIGPGIKDITEFNLPKDFSEIIKLRDDENIDYPLGVDFIFYTKKEIFSIPRLITEVNK